MAVIEYKMHRIDGGTRRAVPDFVGDRGHFFNPADNTFVGWVDDNSDYYIPDTIVRLTKEDFVNRQLAIHAANPMTKSPIGESPVALTEAEVIADSEQWYDNFVNSNS